MMNRVQAGSGSGTKVYPSCPVLKWTYARCSGEKKQFPYDVQARATKYACDQMTSLQKCNSNTNIYTYYTCAGAQLDKGSPFVYVSNLF